MNDSTFILLATSGIPPGVDFYLGNLKVMKINERGQVLKQVVFPNRGYDWFFNNLFKTFDNKYIISGQIYPNSSVSKILVIKLDSNLEEDTFSASDPHTYDYRCGHKIVFNNDLNFGSDTVRITIPFPNTDTLPGPGSFLIYPNPVINEHIHIRSPEPKANVRFLLFDMLGRQIRQMELTSDEKGHNEIALGTIAPGCYLAVLLQGGKKYVQKLIVE